MDCIRSNNYAQNVLTGARELQQINNQITSLQNQAQMLITKQELGELPFFVVTATRAVDSAYAAVAHPGAAYRI